MLSRTRLTCACLAAAALATTGALTAASTATAAPTAKPTPKWSRTLTTDVLAPFQLAVPAGKVYVADGFTGQVSRIDRGTLVPIVTVEGEVAGVDQSVDGLSLAWTSSTADGTFLTVRTKGKADVVTNLAAFEAQHNPDGNVTYGLQNNPAGCDAGKAWLALPEVTGLPATYQGQVDSHPYSVVSLGKGDWAVADAAANDIIKVDAKGNPSVIAVLPKQPLVVTQAFLDAQGAPQEASCLAGLTYAFEPVPTDVERGTQNRLWVSTLPGGPEDPSAGARGSVYTVNQSTGASTLYATGFAGATNLAVAPEGTVYVTELFANKITKVATNKVKSTFAALPGALSVEFFGNKLYAGTLALFGDNGPAGPGTVVELGR